MPFTSQHIQVVYKFKNVQLPYFYTTVWNTYTCVYVRVCPEMTTNMKLKCQLPGYKIFERIARVSFKVPVKFACGSEER